MYTDMHTDSALTAKNKTSYFLFFFYHLHNSKPKMCAVKFMFFLNIVFVYSCFFMYTDICTYLALTAK